MARLHVLRVFVGDDGDHGNPLGVFITGSEVPTDRRQQTAHELGFSETVFVDDRDTGRLEIYTPARPLAFAGHPIVGTAWLLYSQGWTGASLRPPAGEVPVRQHDGLVWLEGRAEWSPQEHVCQLGSPAEVDALAPGEVTTDDLYAWAWMDRGAGIVRARYFAPAFGIVEDEATGSAAVWLGDHLGRALVVHQGRGSRLFVQPGRTPGMVAVGGRVALDAVRDHG